MTRNTQPPNLAALSAALSFAALFAFGDGAAIAPKFLLDDAVVAHVTEGAAATIEGGALHVKLPGGPVGYPGATLHPKQGETWNLSPWGRIEARVTNTSDENLHVNLRVDNPGDWRTNPWNAEAVFLKPGESKTVSVYFGYSYGHKPADYVVDSSRVSALLLFAGKSANDRSFLVEDLQAIGAAGEKPPVDPARVVVKPKDGVLLPMKGAKAANVSLHRGAACEFLPDGTARISFGRNNGGAVRIKPVSGYWNLGDWLKVTVVLRNTGGSEALPTVKIDGGGYLSRSTPKPVAPGETAKIVIPFLPEKPWTKIERDGKAELSGENKFESHRVRGLAFSALGTEASFDVLSVRAEKIVAEPPDWLGKRPPVPGNWTQTLSEEFNAGPLNEKVWSPYASNFWDKRTHFSTNNIIFRDGCCILKYEKKRGAKNDDPSLGETSHACGILTSFGRWTQRYGYFEARMKLPRAPGLWPAFWTMPDRGESHSETNKYLRNSTKFGGMEFDIMEHLTAWGPHRFNVACHWDGYGKEHQAHGTAGIYLAADQDGFITVGMLWLPGVWAIYGNGVELARWEGDRVASVPAHIFFYMVSGGWANEPLDNDLLPDEFAIDWFRAWQREDLK